MTLLTEVKTPADVITNLDTNWVTITEPDAIAKPKFKEGFLGEIATDGNTILIGWSQLPLLSVDEGSQNDKLDNLFEVVIISDHNVEATARSNLMKLLSQVRRHSNRQITNGEWHLDLAIPNKKGHEEFFICSLRQTLFILGD